MVTPFKAIEFAKHDTITRRMLDTVQSNNQWLKDNTPRGRLIAENGAVQDKLTVLVSGRVFIARNKKYNYATRTVRFPAAFDSNCRPNVTTGIMSEGAKEIFVVVNGPSGALLPNSTGFDIQISADDAGNNASKPKNRWRIAKGFYVTWQAMGYRRNDMIDF